MISSNKDLADFQEQVSNIISDISDPQVNDKLEPLMESMNTVGNSDLPFKVEEGTEDKPGKECRQKLNELYLHWKKKGCDKTMLKNVIGKKTYLYIYKYLGVEKKELNHASARFDMMLYKDKNRRCGIF